MEETGRVGRKGARDGERDSQLAQRLDGAVQHGADDQVGQEHRGRASALEGAA